jgi:sugar phosphate permease
MNPDGVTPETSTRRRALFLSWVSYATYYLGRKAFSAIKVPVQRDLGLDSSALGAMDTVNLAAYALGQFVSGTVGDRIGPRRLVGLGMLLAALTGAAFGVSSGLFALGAFYFVNGLAQSTGWPGTTRVVAEWTEPSRRATVMGRWATCYQVGGFVATPLAGFVAAHYGWRAALCVPAVVMALVGAVVLVSLPSPPASPALAAASAPVGRAQLDVLKKGALWLYGTSYFFIKLVRYALMLWLPYYLTLVRGYGVERSAYVASAFDAGGVAGVILIGWLADRTRRFSKPGLSALWITLLVPVLFVYSRIGAGGVLVDVAVLALLGALLFGPDSLLSGAAAQDLGGTAAPAMAVGFVNGLGSCGSVLQGLLIPRLAKRFQWTVLFPVLAVFAFGAVLALVPVLARGSGRRAEGAGSGD